MASNLNIKNRRFESLALIDLFRQTPIGKVVTFDEMKQATNGVDVQKFPGRHFLTSAIKHLSEHEEIHILNAYGDGYYRASHDEAIAYHRTRHKKRFVSDTRRFRRRIESVPPQKLNPDGRRQYSLAVAELSLREVIASQSTERILNEHIAKKPSQSLGMGKEVGDQLIRAFLDAGVTG